MVVLCSLGSKNAKGTSAEPGCHGYTKWRGEKYGARLPTWQQDRAIERLNELVSGGMDAAVLRPGARVPSSLAKAHTTPPRVVVVVARGFGPFLAPLLARGSR